VSFLDGLRMDCCGNCLVHDDDCFIWIHGNRVKNPEKSVEEEEVRS